MYKLLTSKFQHFNSHIQVVDVVVTGEMHCGIQSFPSMILFLFGDRCMNEATLWHFSYFINTSPGQSILRLDMCQNIVQKGNMRGISYMEEVNSYVFDRIETCFEISEQHLTKLGKHVLTSCQQIMLA